MNILFIHQNFPGQFKHLAPELVKKGHDVFALFPKRDVPSSWQGINLKLYNIDRGNSDDIHPLLLDLESKVIRAEACFKAAIELSKEGYKPDVIIAHPGWGESLFLKQVWPSAKLGIYCEFYYHTKGVDVGFDKEFGKDNLSDLARVQLKNANILLHAQQAESAITPTHWQASTFPQHIQGKITVVHDGIDTKIVAPNPKVAIVLPNGKRIKKSDKVITFVSRSLEPYRGFHIFMRAVGEILEAQPDVEILIIGDDGVSYGAHPSGDKTWKEIFSEEVTPQMSEQQRSRLHFLGRIPYEKYLAMLQVSSVHVYLTYPFVLSWSLLEAMSVGCAVVASDTVPLHEVIEDGVNGKLVDFFSHKQLAKAVINLLENTEERTRLGNSARKFAQKNYDLHGICLPRQIKWVEELSNFKD